MGENSLIQWTDHTFNPWWGCAKVSPACKHCYAEEQANRFRAKDNLWGVNGNRSRTSQSNWRGPRKWNEAARNGEPDKVFCASIADVFEDHPQIPQFWRQDLFNLMHETKYLQWQVLTKRPENIKEMVPGGWNLGHWPSNVWIGTTVENQEEYDKRAHYLMDIPAPIRFLSIEPLLGPIEIKHDVDWIIIGGESGLKARRMGLSYLEGIVQQSQSKQIPIFVKQMGTVLAKELGLKHKKGGDPKEWPPELVDPFLPNFPAEYLRRKINPDV